MDPSPPPPPSHSGGREDCWSEGATEALVEAWGERYLQLSRGNLRQKDWQDVADAVNEHQDSHGRPRRTDVQCKNRIDTLKKKYKIEKAKRGPSLWPFFSRLDHLIGSAPASAPASGSARSKKHQLSPAPLPILRASPHQTPNRPPLTFKLKHRPNSALYSGGSSSRSRVNSSPGSSESSHGDSANGLDDDDDDGDNDLRGEDEDEDEEEGNRGLFRHPGVPIPKRRRWEGSMDGGRAGGGGTEEAFGELARAIVKFGEIYERVESSKQQQMMELERQRMEFAKELEFQRMQMFMEAQLELEKMKRPKYSSNAGKRS